MALADDLRDIEVQLNKAKAGVEAAVQAVGALGSDIEGIEADEPDDEPDDESDDESDEESEDEEIPTVAALIEALKAAEE